MAKEDTISISLSELLSMSKEDMIAEAELEFRQATYEYRGRGKPTQDELERPIIVTPFEGNYGRAGLVIAINGSPPRGMVICVEVSRNEWTFDAWSLHNRWERIFDTLGIYKYYTGKKSRLTKATINLLQTKGLMNDPSNL